jgi:serine protease Do
MKTKHLLGALAMAVLGAFIALTVYIKYLDKPATVISQGSASLKAETARPLLTSYPVGDGDQQAGPVDLTYAAEQTVHGVVHVMTKMTRTMDYNPLAEWFYGRNYSSKPQEVRGSGSGVIISPDGYIVTNNHVIEDADAVSVTLNDNREFTAQVVGRDPYTDIALLKIKSDNLPVIKYGDSDALKLGEWVLAVGNPFNLTSTVTAGIISATGRSLADPNDGNRDQLKVESYIQTDAALNMGNSGGALVNTKGQLVGITCAIVSPSGAYAGNSFAIPVNIVKKVVNDLKQYGEVQRAFMGVGIRDVDQDLIKDQNLKLDAVKGIYLTTVNSGGAASEAGLKPKDVITKFNGVNVGTVSELQAQIGKYRPGDKADVTYIRNGKENTVPVTLKNFDNNTKVVTTEEGAGMVFGARIEPIGSQDKSDYGIDNGVKVTELNSGKFKDLGIRKGDIIVSVNGKKVKDAGDVKDFTNNGQSLSSLQGYSANGTEFSFRFNR